MTLALDTSALLGRYLSGPHRSVVLQAMATDPESAIETYRRAIRTIGDRDPTTRRLLESILEVEEEHAEDLVGLLPERTS